MNAFELLTLVDYNYWATGRVLDVAASVSAEQFVAVPAAHVLSLQQTLVHILSDEHLWRTRLEVGATPAALRPEDFPNVDVLQRAWDAEQRAMRAYLATLDGDALGQQVQFRRTSGELSHPFVRWHLPMQMVLHGAQHRSEAAALLTAYGHSPGDLDFLFFVLGRR